MAYANRQDAGKQLAAALRRYGSGDVVVLALPRGGVVLGAIVAQALRAPLGVVLVRKIGHPYYPEFAIGAIAENEPALYDENELAAVDERWLHDAETAARQLIEWRRNLYYRNEVQPPAVGGKVVIIVDDGVATGLTMEAAVRAVRHHHPARIVVAAPVAAAESVEMLEHVADEVVVLDDPHRFLGAIGAHYREFNQINDEAVARLLREANHATAPISA